MCRPLYDYILVLLVRVIHFQLQGTLSEPFTIKTGLRQGDCLSTLLFNLALEKVILDLSNKGKGTILNKSNQLLAFADDIDVVGRNITAVKEGFLELEEKARQMGLRVNEEKTKFLKMTEGARGRIRQNITLGDFNFEAVQSFKYLGSVVNENNDIEEEIRTRILQDNKFYFAMKDIFRSS